jgi:hypothetical protein
MTFRPRIRTIKPEMWADEKVGQLSRDARLLFVGLITMADDRGRLRGMPAGILGHVFPYDVDALRKLDGWLRELTASGLAVTYEHGGITYFYLPGFTRHQVINRSKDSTLPVPPHEAEVTPPVTVPEESVTNHGTVTEPDVKPPGVVRASRAYDGSGTERNGEEANASSSAVAEQEQPDAARLCNLLASLIVANDPKAKVAPDSKGWRDAARRLLALDDRPVEQIEQVIRWSQADPFWRANVLSMPKLRDKYGQLLLKMQTPVARQGARPGWSTEEILAAGRNGQ